jgi:hypothetical protein
MARTPPDPEGRSERTSRRRGARPSAGEAARNGAATGPPTSEWPGLQIDEEIAHQRTIWSVERIAWACIGTALVLGLAGLFGGGPLSRATARAPGMPLRVEFERFGRRESPARLTLHADAAAVRDGVLRVRLGASFLDAARIEQVTPEPRSVRSGPRGLLYEFAVEPDTAPAPIEIDYQAEAIGHLVFNVGLDDGWPLVVNQWVFP